MYYNNMPEQEERFFWAPFLLGGLGGAAIVSATRPRPVYVTSPAPSYGPVYQPYQSSPGYGYNYYGGYNYNPGPYPYYR